MSQACMVSPGDGLILTHVCEIAMFRSDDGITLSDRCQVDESITKEDSGLKNAEGCLADVWPIPGLQCDTPEVRCSKDRPQRRGNSQNLASSRITQHRNLLLTTNQLKASACVIDIAPLIDRGVFVAEYE